MMRKVYLHGPLAAYHDGPITIVANTVAEAVEGVTRQLAGFAPHPVKGRQRIKVVGCETVEDLHRDLGDQEDIHLVPQLSGGKEGGLLQILLGAVLIGVGFFLGGATFFGGLLMKVGAMALLGGLVQMLSPQPDSDDEEQRTRYLGAPQNTVKIGTRISILYGTDRVGGQFLSFDINAVQEAT